eukprot:jgi/Tetstr1/465210/TSEL_009916.t1
MENLMVIDKGSNILKDSNNVVTAHKADHEIEYERSRMLDTLTGMFMHRFNVKGYEVPAEAKSNVTGKHMTPRGCSPAIAFKLVRNRAVSAHVLSAVSGRQLGIRNP